jgi:CheY-like chemotaxis protein
LELAILNLALNAKDAMPRGGELAIELQTARMKMVAADPSGDADEGICIVVRDTGEGMDEATLSRAAEPFFTTKGVGQGTGLGLSMVHGFVSQSNGRIRISSQPSRGTTVELYFALAEREEPTEPTSMTQAASVGERSRTILLVDDDALVAESVSKMLASLGHCIHIAISGADALELVRSRAEIELVLTDQAMPEMTGVELAASIYEIKPSLPVVLGTGCAPASVENERRLPLLSKPYRENDLRRLIASITSADSPS